MRSRFEPSPIEDTAPVLVVSPHLDDAVLSAYAFLKRGGTTTVLTVFCGVPERGTSSDWDRKLGQTEGLDMMQIRLAEDDAALGHLGVATTRLPLLEAGYRDGPMPETDRAELARAVQAWLRESGERAVVLAPAGAGARDTLVYRQRWRSSLPLLRVPGGGSPHPDHIAVRDVVVPTVVASGHRAALYEELPYRWTGRGDRPVARYVSGGPTAARRFHLRVDGAEKGTAVEQYASQTPELFRPWVRDIPAVMPDCERYWLLEPR